MWIATSQIIWKTYLFKLQNPALYSRFNWIPPFSHKFLLAGPGFQTPRSLLYSQPPSSPYWSPQITLLSPSAEQNYPCPREARVQEKKTKNTYLSDYASTQTLISVIHTLMNYLIYYFSKYLSDFLVLLSILLQRHIHYGMSRKYSVVIKIWQNKAKQTKQKTPHIIDSWYWNAKLLLVLNPTSVVMIIGKPTLLILYYVPGTVLDTFHVS